jgi:hypothetical protein
VTWVVIASLVAGIALIAWFAGRQGAQKDQVEKNADIKDKQLAEANKRPRTKSELVDRLRDRW